MLLKLKFSILKKLIIKNKNLLMQIEKKLESCFEN
jgi:hypothetical protein